MTTNELTPHQRDIRFDAQELLDLLDRNVPSTSIDWRVERARRALRVLVAYVEDVVTVDVKARRRAADLLARYASHAAANRADDLDAFIAEARTEGVATIAHEVLEHHGIGAASEVTPPLWSALVELTGDWLDDVTVDSLRTLIAEHRTSSAN